MKSFVTDTGNGGVDELLSAALEARLAHIEELIGELHEWMHSEQVSSLPAAYRRLYSRLLSCEFDRRSATQLTRSIFQSHGARDIGDRQLDAAAAREIDALVRTSGDVLEGIARRDRGERAFVIALVGSSGAGKTTLMYKLAVRAVINFGLRVKIVSSDTYKIGSVEGVQTIADILSVPFGIAFSAEEVRSLVNEADADLVVLDTAGRSDRASRDELGTFLTAADPDETHLVLPATMSQRALQETAALFLGERISRVTFTKVDEAPSLGGLISAVQWMNLPLGYISNGTAIPDDLFSSDTVPLGEWAVEGMPQPDHNAEAQHV